MLPPRPSLLLLVSVGCVRPVHWQPADSGGEGPPPASPDGWGAAQVGQALALGLSSGVPRPLVVLEAYLGLLAQGDEDCPGTEPFLTDGVVLGCESDSGYWYAGVSDFLVSDPDTLSDPVFEDGWLMGGDFEIITPEGELFRQGGGVQQEWAPSAVEARLGGSIVWEGADAPWLAGQVSGYLDASVRVEEGRTQLGLSGALSAHGAELHFEDWVWSGEPDCGAPVGTVQVREPPGLWHTLQRADPCAPCLDWFDPDGRSAGEVCVDLTAAGAQNAGALLADER